MSLNENPTLKACSSFLVNFIAQSRDSAEADVIQSYGENLVSVVLIQLGISATRHAIEAFSDLLLALNKKYCDNLSRWLNTLLAVDNFPSPKISRVQKEQFIRTVLR